MVKQTYVLAVFVLFIGGSLNAQQPSSSTTQLPGNPTAQIIRTVAFLRVEFTKNGKLWNDKGTGFFVEYPDKRIGETGGFVYLVTNRHVAQPGSDSGAIYPVTQTHLRMNLRNASGDDSAQEINFPASTQWFFPADKAVDLAVLPFAPDEARFDYSAMPISFFATSEVVKSRAIGEGDNVLFAGYFYQFPGLQRIEPIVRQGIIAMMPREKMETTLHKQGLLYLADVHVFGGNSGAPLFVNVTGARNGNLILGGFPYLLLGVVSGYYFEDTDLNLTVATTTITGKLGTNSGISVVVPADQLKALLDSAALQNLRDRIAAGTSQLPH